MKIGLCTVLLFLLVGCATFSNKKEGVRVPNSKEDRTWAIIDAENCEYDTFVNFSQKPKEVQNQTVSFSQKEIQEQIGRKLFIICTPKGELRNFISSYKIQSADPKSYIIEKTSDRTWTKTTSQEGVDNLLIYYSDKDRVDNIRYFLANGNFVVEAVEREKPCYEESALVCESGHIDRCLLDDTASYHKCVLDLP